MDTFSACLALGPLAVYLLLLGVINLARRPLVVSGTRETLSLGLALMGLAVVGPMQLFLPQEAATRFGQFVWLLLLGFYLLFLTLAVMLSRPRIVVYNVSVERLQAVLDETARRLDAQATWAGKALSMPSAHVHLQLDSFSPLANVSLVATSDDQSIGGWRRLAAALRANLRDVPSASQSQGFWLVTWGFAVLAALALWAAEDPQAIARGLDRLLNQ
jgi:hypothetical protein